MESSTSSKAESQLECVIEQETPKKKNGLSETMSNKESGGTSTAGLANVSNLAVKALRVSATPRIDISRASSSSQHEDSRDSSPENVFEQVSFI